MAALRVSQVSPCGQRGGSTSHHQRAAGSWQLAAGCLTAQAVVEVAHVRTRAAGAMERRAQVPAAGQRRRRTSQLRWQRQ